MNWLLKVIVYIAAALIFAIANTISANLLEVEISGNMGARIVYRVATTLWGWCLFMAYLELSGAKITWPN